MNRRSAAGRARNLGLAIVLLAFALRLWGLTATSLWYDETFMLAHAGRGLPAALVGLWQEDNAIPLFGLLLTLWVNAVGHGEFVARYLPALLGTATVPLVQRLTHRLTRRGGWGGALAFALLPIHIYYAQEVRMYALATLLAAAFALSAWRVLQHGRGTLAYILLGVGMITAHLYAVTLWGASLVWGMSVLGRGMCPPHPQGRAWRRANGGLLLATLPIAAWAAWRATADTTATSAIPLAVVRWLPLLFGVGQYLPHPWAGLFALLTAAAILAALILLARQGHKAAPLWIAITLTVPVILLLMAAHLKAKWSERYLLASFGLAWVVGTGAGWETLLSARRRSLRLIGGLLLGGWLTLTFPALARQAQGTWAVAIRDEWHPRPDFRGVARYLEAHATAEDAIVVVGGYATHTLAYYYDGPARLFGLPPETRLLDTTHPLDLHALEELEARLGEARTLWLVLWQAHLADPTDVVQSTLVETCRRLPVAATFTNVGLLHFELEDCRPLDRPVTPPYPLHIPFAAPIVLEGYDLIRTGETWEVDLWWTNQAPLPEAYIVFVHLLAPDGTMVAQHDHIAGADAYPTNRWLPGTRLRDRFFLHVPGGRCEGCSLLVGLYTDAGRLPLREGGDSACLPLPTP